MNISIAYYRVPSSPRLRFYLRSTSMKSGIVELTLPSGLPACLSHWKEAAWDSVAFGHVRPSAPAL